MENQQIQFVFKSRKTLDSPAPIRWGADQIQAIKPVFCTVGRVDGRAWSRWPLRGSTTC